MQMLKLYFVDDGITGCQVVTGGDMSTTGYEWLNIINMFIILLLWNMQDIDPTSKTINRLPKVKEDLEDLLCLKWNRYWRNLLFVTICEYFADRLI